MKIIYSKEKNITWKICGVIGIINLLFIPADLLFNNAHLVSIYFLFVFVALLMGAGAWFAHNEIKAFKDEREFIVSNGYKCRGEVINCIKHNRSDKWYTTLRIRYHSQILDRDITFDTDFLYTKLEKNEGMYCTVYETHATEYKNRGIEKIRRAVGLSGDNDGSDPDFEPQELSCIADAVENA